MEPSPPTTSWRLFDDRGSEGLSRIAPLGESLWVGGTLTSMPGASAFGIFSRLVRLNALLPRDLFRAFGLRLGKDDDISQTLTFSGARMASFARSLGLEQAPSTWSLDAWLPFRSNKQLFHDPWKFRYCPICLRMGYHTLLHQLPWIKECSWHKVQLTTQCVKCGANINVKSTWVLDGNLRCSWCENELLDTDATLSATQRCPHGSDECVDSYLGWAERARVKTVLLSPDAGTASFEALADLVSYPRSDQEEDHTSEKAEAQRRRDSSQALDLARNLKLLEVIRKSRPGFLHIPENMRRALSNVASNLALKLPPHVLTAREMQLFLAGLGLALPASFKGARRPDTSSITLLPPTGVAGDQYLDLTCMHPASYGAIAQLIDAVVDNSVAAGDLGQLSAPEAGILLNACRALLCSGYAQGLRCTLSRYVPELYGMGRDRPHLTEPWLLVVFSRQELVRVLIRQRPMMLRLFGEADALEHADAANRRRPPVPTKKASATAARAKRSG